MYILDAIIIIIFILGIMSGVKNGAIKSTVSLVGMILCILLAFYLKNPLSAFFYKNLPFFNIKGAFQGVTIINIIIREHIFMSICLFMS